MTQTVLLVEDDDFIREIAAASLETIGEFRVVTAAAGDEAIRLAITEHPDAILLDVMMPGMDGPTTLAALRCDTRTTDIPVAFLTAKVHAADQEALMALGVHGVLSKPFDPVVLPDQVRATFGWDR